MLFDGVSARRDILTMQFNVFPEDYSFELPTLFGDICLKSWTSDIKSGGHPNETGHEKIAQHLINLIDPAIIVA
jgi:lysophospholipase L1-like esterase